MMLNNKIIRLSSSQKKVYRFSFERLVWVQFWVDCISQNNRNFIFQFKTFMKDTKCDLIFFETEVLIVPCRISRIWKMHDKPTSIFYAGYHIFVI